MKNKSVLITAGIAVVFLTAILFVIVFSMQHARAEQPLEMEQTAEELPQEIIAEESAETELPEEETEQTDTAAPEDPAGTEETEAPAEQTDTAAPEESAEDPEEETEAAAEGEEEEKATGGITIGCFTQSQKNLKPSEVVESNWKNKKPSAADITEEQAIEIATNAGKEIFGLKNTEIETAEFYKDMTGQRSSYWQIWFKEGDLVIDIDSLSGNIARADSEYHRENGTPWNPSDPFYRTEDQIWNEEESGQGDFTAATKAIAEKYIKGKVKQYSLNAVHDGGKHYPLVSIDVVMEDGTVYEFEWARCGKDGTPTICYMFAFPSWDHFGAWASWDADLIASGGSFA